MFVAVIRETVIGAIDFFEDGFALSGLNELLLGVYFVELIRGDEVKVMK